MMPRAFRDLSIRYKLFLSLVSFMLAFLCLFLALNTLLAINANKNQTLSSASHVFGQTRAYLQYRMESVRNYLYALTANPALQELFERQPDYYEQEIGRWPIDSQAFEKLTYITYFNPEIRAVRFYMKEGLAAVFQNDSYIQLARVQSEDWYRRLISTDRHIYWFYSGSSQGSQSDGYLHVARVVFARQNVNQITGVVQFDISPDVLKTTLDRALLTPATEAVLMNESGDVVYDAGSDAEGAARLLWERVRAARGGDFTAESWDPISINGSTFLVGTEGIENSDWTLMMILPNREIVKMSARPARQMLLVFFLIIPLILLFALIVSRSATGRIQELTRNMDRVVQGDFSITAWPENRDEIGRLTERFNFMITEIERLVEDKYNLGKEVKNQELKALQAQINPHFLYNTLDLINWKSMEYGASEIGSVVMALARFYKLSLNDGQDLIALRDEIEHAELYVQIQNMRYENGIGLSIDVPEELLEHRILKLIIQPLVENSILHGILQKPEQRGRVAISARAEGERIVIRVEDDGVGIPEKRLGELLSGTIDSHDRHGYGVRNVHERIVLTYGAEFGLDFQSYPGKGTTVRVTIPEGER